MRSRAPEPWEFTVRQRPPRQVCGIWMPNAKEPCARRPGHGTPDHRTRWALDNALYMHTRRRAMDDNR